MLQERLLAKRLIRTLLRQLSSIPLFSAIHTSTCWQPPSSANSNQCSATLPFSRHVQKQRRQTNRNVPPQSAHSSLCQIPTIFLSFAKCVGISTSARDTLFHIAATWPFPVKQPCQTSVYALSRNPPTHFAYPLMPGVHPITFHAPSTPGNAVGGTRIRPWLTRFPICPLDKKRDNQPKKGAYHE